MLSGPTDSDVRYHSVRMDRPMSSEKSRPRFMCANGDVSHHICETRELMGLKNSRCAIFRKEGNGSKWCGLETDQRPGVQAKQVQLEMIIQKQ